MLTLLNDSHFVDNKKSIVAFQNCYLWDNYMPSRKRNNPDNHLTIPCDIEGWFFFPNNSTSTLFRFGQWKINGKIFSLEYCSNSHWQVLEKLVFDQGDHPSTSKFNDSREKTKKIAIPKFLHFLLNFHVSRSNFHFYFPYFHTSYLLRYFLKIFE